MKTIHLALAFVSLAPMAMAETPVLTVLTYDSFAADWGPGPAIAKGFEETCACKVAYVTAGDGAAVLSRRASGRLLVAVLTAALCAASLNQSLSPGWPRNPVAVTLSGLILAHLQPDTRVLINPEDDIGPSVQTQLLIDRVTAPVFPEIVAAKDITAAIAAIAKGTVFLVVTSRQWRDGYAPVLPEPTCLWTAEPAVLALWTDLSAPCPKVSG